MHEISCLLAFTGYRLPHVLRRKPIRSDMVDLNLASTMLRVTLGLLLDPGHTDDFFAKGISIFLMRGVVRVMSFEQATNGNGESLIECRSILV